MSIDTIAAYVSLVTNDDGAVQLMQGEGEQPDDASSPEATPDMAVMLPYGFSAHPPVGSDLIAVQVEGRSEQTVIAAQHRASRPTGLKEGEVALHMRATVLAFLDEDGKIHLGARTGTDAAVLGDALKLWLESMTVPTAFGPSGTPINAADLVNILSEIVKVA